VERHGVPGERRQRGRDRRVGAGSSRDRAIYRPLVSGRVLTRASFMRATDFNSILIRRHTAARANFIILAVCNRRQRRSRFHLAQVALRESSRAPLNRAPNWPSRVFAEMLRAAPRRRQISYCARAHVDSLRNTLLRVPSPLNG